MVTVIEPGGIDGLSSTTLAALTRPAAAWYFNQNGALSLAENGHTLVHEYQLGRDPLPANSALGWLWDGLTFDLMAWQPLRDQVFTAIARWTGWT